MQIWRSFRSSRLEAFAHKGHFTHWPRQRNTITDYLLCKTLGGCLRSFATTPIGNSHLNRARAYALLVTASVVRGCKWTFYILLLLQPYFTRARGHRVWQALFALNYAFAICGRARRHARNSRLPGKKRLQAAATDVRRALWRCGARDSVARGCDEIKQHINEYQVKLEWPEFSI